ncbi:hypothetical protein O6H91_21G016700 [Diphasiastrum complanatum]|uniref:Uncharacterized protein n=1 Tax=Diphasiastrum complanatum TaxID=34168 RepID=A0ACC2AIC7_DIPCM|nr:hypothetical protein O6H91_21G016700 [Diphasiastrum complanatum]
MAQAKSFIVCPAIRCATEQSSSCLLSRRRLDMRATHRNFCSSVFVQRMPNPCIAVGILRRKRGFCQLMPHKFLLAALEEDSAFVETKVEELKKEAEKSKEVFNEAVDKLKDGALKLQDYTKFRYEESAEKTLEILRDTSEQLKKQSEIAVEVLTVTAQETAEKGKENLSLLAETAPDPIKDVAATALDAHFQDKDKKGSKIHDFCLGIPFGGLLVIGGLLGFLITESTSALRFGVMLGGFHLYLSIKSLKVWKQGTSSLPYIKGQAAITLILFVRELRRFFECLHAGFLHLHILIWWKPTKEGSFCSRCINCYQHWIGRQMPTGF